MKKTITNEQYQSMLSYQRWYYETMPDEQRSKYLERKRKYNAKKRLEKKALQGK